MTCLFCLLNLYFIFIKEKLLSSEVLAKNNCFWTFLEFVPYQPNETEAVYLLTKRDDGY